MIAAMTAAAVTAQEDAAGNRCIIRQPDRIMIESGDPEALCDFFAEKLKLPVAWPFTANETYSSGSVSAGDVTLEFYRYGDKTNKPAVARFASLSLEPCQLDEALMRLRIKGIPYDPPQIRESTLPDGSEGPAWMQVQLPSISSPLFPVTLFEYSPQFLNTEVRRKVAGNRLVLNGGGPLGIASTLAIVLEFENLKKSETEWDRLLGNPGPDGYFHAEKGPALRLIRGSENGIQRIIFKVKSLAEAEAYLENNSLLGETANGEVFLKPSAVQGLRVSLAENLPTD